MVFGVLMNLIEDKKPIVFAVVKMSFGSAVVKESNFVNIIYHEWKLGQTSYVKCRCTLLTTRSIVFGGSQQMFEVNRVK